MSFQILAKLPDAMLAASDTAIAGFDADGIARPTSYHEKMYLLSPRHSLALTGAGRMRAGTIARLRRRFHDEAWIRAADSGDLLDVARLVGEALAAELAPHFAALLPGTPAQYWGGWIFGLQGAVRIRVDATGLSFMERALGSADVGFTGPPDAIPAVRELAKQHQPHLRGMTLDQAAAVAVDMVDAHIVWHNSRPASHDWLYGGPVSVLALERGQPPRWLRSLATTPAAA